MLVKRGAGTLTLTGSSDLGANFLIGDQGTVQISSSGAFSDTGGIIGYGSGAAAVSGSGATWTNTSNLYIGYSGTGTLAISSGGSVSDVGGYIGYNAGSSGSVTVSGTGSSWANTASLTIGQSASGTLAIETGARVSVTGMTTVGSLGTLEFDGASTFNTGSLAVNGGTFVTLGASTFASSATLGAGGININSGGVNSTFSGNFSGTGGLAKTGAGTITLTGSSTYTGATAVNAGTLALTTGSAQTASLGNTTISVAAGATFSPTLAASHFSTVANAGTTGSGTAGATLTLAPGSAFSMAGGAVGTFNLQQQSAFSGPAFTIGGASGAAPALTFAIGNASTGPDSIDVTKTVTVLATGASITIDALAGDTGLTAGNYDLITSAGGFSGTGGNDFTLANTTLVVDGTTYDFSLADSTADDEVLTVSVAAVSPALESRPFADPATPSINAPANPTNTPLIGTTAVPEPGTTAGLLSALALATAVRFRRRKSPGTPIS
jgi:T5SS/PEP-CTERM-associated repeat protein/autotransporter-associated beta strand protein